MACTPRPFTLGFPKWVIEFISIGLRFLPSVFGASPFDVHPIGVSLEQTSCALNHVDATVRPRQIGIVSYHYRAATSGLYEADIHVT